MKIRPQGLAPRDVGSLELQLTLKHTAYASPCMFSRLERDVRRVCVYYFFGFLPFCAVCNGWLLYQFRFEVFLAYAYSFFYLL